MDEATLTNLALFAITALSAGLSALWLGMTMWTWQDMRARSRDPLARIAATLLVFLLPFFGLMVYLMLRPRETLADVYERSLEEEALLQEIEEKPACPGCGRAVKGEWQVCPYCHTRLKKLCINCNYTLDLNWNLCPMCATAQVSYEDAPRLDEAPAEQAAPARRSVIRDMRNEQSPYEYREDLEFIDE